MSEGNGETRGGFSILEPIGFSFGEALGNVGRYVAAGWAPLVVFALALLSLPVLIEVVPSMEFFKILFPTEFGPAGPPVTLAVLVTYGGTKIAMLLMAPALAIWIRMAASGQASRTAEPRYPFGKPEWGLGLLLVALSIAFEGVMFGGIVAAFSATPESSGYFLLALLILLFVLIYLGIRSLPVMGGLVCAPEYSLLDHWRLAKGVQLRLIVSTVLFVVALLVASNILMSILSMVFYAIPSSLDAGDMAGGGDFLGTRDSPFFLILMIGFACLVSVLFLIIASCFIGRVYSTLRQRKDPTALGAGA